MKTRIVKAKTKAKVFPWFTIAREGWNRSRVYEGFFASYEAALKYARGRGWVS